MSEHSHTVVSHESWISRIGGAFKGVVIGLILIVASFPVLFLNEGRAVKREKTLDEGSGAVVSISADKIDAGNRGKLVHLTGRADTEATLADDTFGISTKSLKLQRVVEMYQWQEKKESHTEKKTGGSSTTSTKYSYEKVWSDEPINSSQFNNPTEHSNPAKLPYENSSWNADKVTLGSFVLSPSLVGKINDYKPLPVSATLPNSLQDKAKVQDGGYYIGENPAAPQVGDVRIRFESVEPTDISVIAAQTDHSFEPYLTKAGGSIELIETGIHNAQEMFATAHHDNTVMTWILRLVGFVLMFAGLNMLFRPLAVLADVLPILGSIVSAGTGFISLLISASLSLVTIAVAWIVYRPVLGSLLLAGAIAVTILMKGKLKKPAAVQ